MSDSLRLYRFPLSGLNSPHIPVSFLNLSMHSRRQLLKTTACGFGSIALSGLLGKSVHAKALPMPMAMASDPLAPKLPMFPARAKRVIFLFMAGGPSHVDSFDYKPELIARDGQSIDFTGVRFDTFGKKSQR